MPPKFLTVALALFAGVLAPGTAAAANAPVASSPVGAYAFSVSLPPGLAGDDEVGVVVRKAVLDRGWHAKEGRPNGLVFGLREHGVDATVTLVVGDMSVQAFCDAYKIKDLGRGASVTPKRWLNTLRDDVAEAIGRAEPAIVVAAENGDTATLRTQLSRLDRLDARGADGKTALIAAAERGDRTECELLIHAGASVVAADWAGDSPLTIALIRQDVDLANRFSDAGAVIPSIGTTTDTRFYYGAYQKLVADRRAKEGKMDEAGNRYEVARAVLSAARVRYEREAVATVENGKEESARETKETEVKVATFLFGVAAIALAARLDAPHGSHSWNGVGHFHHEVGPIFRPHPVPLIVVVPVPIYHNAGSAPTPPGTPAAQPIVVATRIPPPPGEPVYVDPGHSTKEAVEAFYTEAAWLHSMALLCDNLLEALPAPPANT